MKNINGHFVMVLALLFLLSVNNNSYGQGASVNTAGIPADSSAMFDVGSTTKGLLIPRMTTAQRNAIIHPATGLMIYNLDCNNFNYNAGTPSVPNWLPVNSNSTLSTPGPITGQSGVCPNQTGITYSIPPVPGATTYNWTVPSGASIVSGQGTTAISVNFGNAFGDVCVSAGNSCGNSIAACSGISFYTAPSITSNPANTTVCETGNTSFSVVAVGAGLTYQWQEYSGNWSNLSNGGVYSNVTSAVANITGAPAGMNGWQYRCIVSGTCNPSPVTSAAAALTVATLPSSAFSWLPVSPGRNQSCVFTPTLLGATYNWTFQSGTPATSTAQNPSVLWVSSGTYNTSLVVNFAGCSSTTSNPVTVLVCSHGSQTFSYSGSIVTWTVPSIACSPVTIEVWGAQGGNSGGLGARMRGEFSNLAGQTLSILVGGQGGSGTGHSCWEGGGGGGGSFVATNTNTALVVAGGGGGATAGSSTAHSDGVTATSGVSNPNCSGGGTGGNGGQGGCSGNGDGAGGGGFNSNGGNGYQNAAFGGYAFINGGAGGAGGGDPVIANGGFGGGGGAWTNCGMRSGGGGGYSGGQGGTGTQSVASGGGGGSYNAGTNQSNSAGVRTGNGQVVISW
ncbi:MAG: hypothetical protein WCM76_16320 [Bacteroidota bacterium]